MITRSDESGSLFGKFARLQIGADLFHVWSLKLKLKGGDLKNTETRFRFTVFRSIMESGVTDNNSFVRGLVNVTRMQMKWCRVFNKGAVNLAVREGYFSTGFGL